LRERLGYPIPRPEAELLERVLAPVRHALGGGYAAAEAGGAGLELDEAVDEALALIAA
jgi:hypothetical protein